MNYKELYQDTISKLKRDERPLIKLTQELVIELKTEWQKAISGDPIDEVALKQILCILDNAQNMSAEFNEHFFMTIEKLNAKLKDGDLLIYTLSASQKHVVGEALKSGVMISEVYFDHLKKLLKNKNPEVQEWTLRTIESMGPLSLRLKKEVLEAKPGFMRLFSSHQKSSSQIIELLEKQWERMKL